MEGATALQLWKSAEGVISPGIKAGAAHLWRKFQWDRAEEQYRQALLFLVQTTRLLGHPAPVNIDETYTAVYVLDRLSAIREFDIKELEGKTFREDPLEEQKKRRPALEVVKSTNRVYIVGKPGAGKTTFLKYLAILACKGLLPKIPIFVS